MFKLGRLFGKINRYEIKTKILGLNGVGSKVGFGQAEKAPSFVPGKGFFRCSLFFVSAGLNFYKNKGFPTPRDEIYLSETGAPVSG